MANQWRIFTADSLSPLTDREFRTIYKGYGGNLRFNGGAVSVVSEIPVAFDVQMFPSGAL